MIDVLCEYGWGFELPLRKQPEGSIGINSCPGDFTIDGCFSKS